MKGTLHPLMRVLLYSIRILTLMLASALLVNGSPNTTPKSPASDAPHRLTRAKAAGWLKVYSEEGRARDDDAQGDFVHTDYTVLTSEGRSVMRVNNAGSIGKPAIVLMNLDRYVVVAQADERGIVRLPVSIKTGRTTVLHLDQANGGDIPRS
ncbi:MAG: hypothetical protein ABIP20_16565 [Chthoniobacteraceae bacterium]